MKKSRGNWGSLWKKKPLITHSMINSISLQLFSSYVAEAKWFLYIISATIREMLTGWDSKLTLCILRRKGNRRSFNKLLWRIEKELVFWSGHYWQMECQALAVFSFSISQLLYERFCHPSSTKEGPELRKFKWLAQGHTAHKRRLELWPKSSRLQNSTVSG